MNKINELKHAMPDLVKLEEIHAAFVESKKNRNSRILAVLDEYYANSANTTVQRLRELCKQ